MKSVRIFIFILILCLGGSFSYPPSSSAAAADAPALTSLQAVKKTAVELRESSVQLDWREQNITVNGVFHLVNPTDNKITLSLQLQTDSEPVVTAVRMPAEIAQQPPLLTNVYEKQTLETRYDRVRKRYLWEISLAPNEALDLLTAYTITPDKTSIGDNLHVIGFAHPASTLWGAKPGPCTVLLNLAEIHPGQIAGIQPKTYKFSNNALLFSLLPGAEESLRVTADVYKEKLSWETLLTENDRNNLNTLNETEDYLAAADLFAKAYESAPSKDKEPLLIGQAYYLEKAQKSAEADAIWRDLYDNGSKSPRVYWALGKANAKQPSKLKSLYNKVKELEVHPLTQSWLLAQLQDYNIAPSLPEITITTPSSEDNKKGIALKSRITDKDGDIAEAKLIYHWEDEKPTEYAFSLSPYKYEYELDYFIPAPGPLHRLYYELTVTDEKGNVVSTGQKETFFLNEELPSETIPLPGAILVMADYTPAEQDKVYKWFKSYLKMAKEAEFVPLASKQPYFIFLGKPRGFAENYSGQLFIQFTETPFVPGAIENNIHRLFLSNLYGPGWMTLPEQELNTLGDGLLLGKGMSVLTLKYLLDKDDYLFAALLAAIGQGQDWTGSVRSIYGLDQTRLKINVLWHATGSFVIAVIIIIFLAWLGKTGCLVRFINFLRSNR